MGAHAIRDGGHQCALLNNVESAKLQEMLPSRQHRDDQGSQSGEAAALQRSTLRRKVNREEHALVPAEFRKWVWAGGRKLKGLVRRREAEAARYSSV